MIHQCQNQGSVVLALAFRSGDCFLIDLCARLELCGSPRVSPFFRTLWWSESACGVSPKVVLSSYYQKTSCVSPMSEEEWGEGSGAGRGDISTPLDPELCADVFDKRR